MRRISFLFLLLLLCSISCKAPPTPRATVRITLVGADSMQWLAKSLTDAYAPRQPNVAFTIQASNSDAGLRAATDDSRTIGMVSRKIKPDEITDARAVVVALDGIAIVVNRVNPITSIMRSQIVQVFSGEIFTWPTALNSGKEIVVLSREAGSGTRDAFETMAMNSTRVTRTAIVLPGEADVVDYIAKHPEAIGYTSMGALTPDVRALMVDDVPLTPQTVESLKYPFVRTLAFIVPQVPDPEIQHFIDFVLGSEGQHIVTQRFARAAVNGRK